MALIEVRLKPTTPWRVGHGAGDRERVDVVYHSDALYSAITHAMKTLGWLDEWLAATARSEGATAVRFSSLFPFIGKTRLIAPPKTWWPPANPGRLFLEAAKLIPLEVVRNGIVDEARWMVDAETGCMVPVGSGSPLTIAVRTAAAVDRLTGVVDPHRIACLEFAANAGWWGVFSVEDEVWMGRVKSAFRLLADSGFGGERSRGWGRSAPPEFADASGLLPSKANEDTAWWLLSVYSPASGDAVDWSRGEYGAVQRGGWTDSQAGVAPKKQVRVIEEGSVLFAPALEGRAVDVAPDGFAHPVYRAGFAFVVPAPAEPVVRQKQVEPAPAPIVEDVVIPAEPDEQVADAPPATDEPVEPAQAEVILPADEGSASAPEIAASAEPPVEDVAVAAQEEDIADAPLETLHQAVQTENDALTKEEVTLPADDGAAAPVVAASREPVVEEIAVPADVVIPIEGEKGIDEASQTEHKEQA